MKKKNFTLIELLTVMTLMAILLGISMNILKPDRAAAAIKQVGGNICTWSATAMAEDTSYRMEFTKTLLEVYDINNKLVHSEKILSPLTFTNGNSQTIEFNKMGAMEDIMGARIYADTWVAKVNGFTGHLSYYEDKEEEE